MRVLLLSILTLVFSAACSERPDYFLEGLNEKRVHNIAPRSSTQTGHLVHGATDQQMSEFTEKHPDSRIRPLYPKQGLYEVFTDKPENLPNATQNVFIPNQLQDSFQTKGACEQSGEDLAIEIIFSENPEAHKALTVEIKGADKLNTQLQIDAPRGSLVDIKADIKKTFSFKPDQAGIFRYNFLIKDPKNTLNECWIETRLVDVKHNPKFQPENAFSNQIVNSYDRSPFWYLEKLISPETPITELIKNKIIVAVIDSGVNYNHPALASVISVTDNSIGYDFVDGDSYPFDPIGHGTHLAALIASPINGISKNAKILPIRAFSYFGYDLGSLVAALYYAADNGAQIINLSAGWIGDPQSELFEPLKKAINYIKSKNIVLVVAAGNGDPFNKMGFDISLRTFLPASFATKNFTQNMIVVAATNQENQLTSYSNYSNDLVDLATLGGTSNEQILSADMQTAAGNLWFYRYGTSQATALVSGSYANFLIDNPWSIDPAYDFLLTRPNTDTLKEYVQFGRYLKQ